MSDVFDLGLVLLKLDDLGFFVFEVLKDFNEGLQGFAKISDSFTKFYESWQRFAEVYDSSTVLRISWFRLLLGCDE